MNSLSERFTNLSEEKQALLLKLSREKRAAQFKTIPSQPRDGRSYPLSYNQQRLWFLSQFSDEAAVAYNLPWAIDLHGSLNMGALRQSMQWLIDRHEPFRTRFELLDNEPRQLILDSVECPWQINDWRDVAAAKRSKQWQDAVQTAVAMPFDLTQAPPFRVQLYQFSEEWVRLLFVVHHIAFDGWSSGIFFAELGHGYSAFAAGASPNRPPLPVQYADYAQWQKTQDASLTPQLDYWQAQLHGNLPPLNLPTDFPRPAVQTYRGKSVHTLIPSSLVQALQRLSQEENGTLYMILLAAFKVLLYRYTGQTDLLVGTPVANRSMVELESLIGFFVNTLVLRSDLSDAPTYRTLLQRVRQVVEAAFSHQEVPLEKLIERLQPERHLSHNPLFQVMFALHNVPQQGFHFDGLEAMQLDVVPDVAQFELSLYLSEAADGLVATLYFNEDLFTEATAEQLLRHYHTLLESIANQPDQSIAQLPLMGTDEWRKLLDLGRQTAVSYPNHHCIHHLFQEQAARTPEAAALTFESDTITYHELNQRANQLAHHLQSIGLIPDTSVGVYMTRSIEMVVAVLAVLKAGGAYLPLDPTYPPQRIAFMVEDADVPVILTQASLAAQLPAHSAQLVRVDSDWSLIQRQRTNNPVTTVTAAHLSYLIYTSGSTGKPKGVMVEHRNVVNFFTGMDAVIPRHDCDVWLSVTSLSFDISVLELLWTLTRGFHVVLLADKSHTKAAGSTDPAFAFSALVQRHGVTHFQCTPTLASMLLLDQDNHDAFAQIGTILLGGEALPPALAQTLRQMTSGTLLNMYGPTETTIWSTTHVVTPDDALVIPIGRPIANTDLYIVDKQNQPVPVGVPGELLIGGDGVTRGYRHRPALTAEKFIENPFGSGRLYRTGDLARFRADGTVEFLGRIDHQVKLRGHRIELGEIEARLAEHTAVNTAIVMVQNDEQLTAYLHTNKPVTPDDLRNQLQGQLPAYMIPAHFLFLDEFPRTPNGKIDRKALPPVNTTNQPPDGLMPPETETEALLAEVWSELLHVAPIGRHADFFKLGGHSLLATQIIARLNQLLELNLPIFLLFESPTIAQLAAKIEAVLFAEFAEQSVEDC